MCLNTCVLSRRLCVHIICTKWDYAHMLHVCTCVYALCKTVQSVCVHISMSTMSKIDCMFR